MRVIAGKARSVRLQTPEGLETRPTTDRIKETLFNMINFDLPGANFLDLFSGSGAMGIEAMSRGANKATFMDSEKEPVRCIRENIKKTRFEEQSQVIQSTIEVGLAKLQGQKFDVIFMDPPYSTGLDQKALELIQTYELLAEEGYIIVERSTEDVLKYDSEYYRVVKEKGFRTTTMTFLTQEEQ